MASFHTLHWIPDPRLHIFNGYNEVIETLLWGLRSLGHHASYAVNDHPPDIPAIVFGAQLMDRAGLDRLPRGSILYNLEQLQGLRATGRALDDLAYASRRLKIWDYSALNLETWLTLGAADTNHLPIGFAPPLSRIQRPVVQDIEVLIYGAPSASRLAVLHELCGQGISAMFFCGLYGAARDALIGRAKIVLCLTSNADSSIFSIVRASYLLANHKAVVADFAHVERDMVDAVAFAPPGAVADLCGRYLRNETARRQLEESGFSIMARRDIRPLLKSALST